VVCVGNVGGAGYIHRLCPLDEEYGIHNRMTALWYKWYIHLREEGYSIGTALVAGWWNASVNAQYWTEGPKKWVDNRPERYYRG